LKKNKIYDDVNIIITSDHGMSTLNQSKTIPLLPHLNLKQVDLIIDYGTGAGIWPKPGIGSITYNRFIFFFSVQNALWLKVADFMIGCELMSS